MKNNNVRGILALILVTALSFGVIAGSKALTRDSGAATAEAEVKVLEELDVNGAEGIEKAVRTENGYMVTVLTRGYGGDIKMNVSFDADAQTLTKVEVAEQNETPDVGARIAEDEFLSQFKGVAAPVYLPGMTLEEKAEPAAPAVAEDAELQDGTYTAKTAQADDNGFVGEVNLTVEGGKITAVNWDYVTADGTRKSVMSENGEYTMTEDGPTWKEQSEALAAALVENQSLGFFTVDEQGKTDAVSGVSISIGEFLSLAEDCMKQAAGVKEAAVLQDGTYVADAAEADQNGFVGEVSMTIADGKITNVVWDYITADGTRKSVMSENGEYTMTEDGPTWKEQSEALAAALIENQSLDFFTVDEQGKTDAVSGVSISIGEFLSLAEQCLNDAAGLMDAPAAPQNGTQVDAVSGASISSKAAVVGINKAYTFLQTVK